MLQKIFASSRSFAVALATIVSVFCVSVMTSCSDENLDETITPMAKVWVWEQNILFCNGEPIFVGNVDQKFPMVSLTADKQGVPALTSQSNPTKVSDVRTETTYGYSDSQVHTAWMEIFGGYKVSANIYALQDQATSEVINDHMMKVTMPYRLTGTYTNENYSQNVLVPFEATISKEYIQADETVKVDTVVNVITERVVERDTITNTITETVRDTVITYIDNYIYQTDTVYQEVVKVDTMVVEKVVEKIVEKVINKTDTIYQTVEVPVKVVERDTIWQTQEVPVYVEVHDTIYKEVVKEVLVPVEVEKIVEVHDTLYYAVHDTVTVEKTVEVEKYIEKYLDKDLNRHSFLGGATATLKLDGDLLLDFTLNLTYQTVEVEKNIWGSNQLTREGAQQFFYNDGQIAGWSAKTKNATVESVTYQGTTFTDTEIGSMKMGKTSFLVKGTYQGIGGKTENFEFEVNPYYLQLCKAEPQVVADVYTYEFSATDEEFSLEKGWVKTFTATRYLNGKQDKTWSYKKAVAEIGQVTGAKYHVKEAKLVSENLTSGTSSTRWEEQCGEKVLSGKNKGWTLNTDCRLYDYEIQFPSTAGGVVGPKSQIAYWTREISFADPDRPEDEAGQHTWSFGDQNVTVTKHGFEKDSTAPSTFQFTDVNGKYENTYVLTLDIKVGETTWCSQTALSHLYK